MPGLADLIYGTAQQATNNVAQGIPQGVTAGVELALRKQQLDQAQRQMQLKMQELQQTKIQKLYSFIEEAKNYKSAADRNNYLRMAPQYAASMGLPPDTLPEMKNHGSDENYGRQVTLTQMVNGNVMTPAQALQTMKDPVAWAKVPVAPTESVDYDKAGPDFEAALEKFSQRKSEEMRAQLAANTKKEIADAKREGSVEAGKEKSDAELANQIRTSFKKISEEQTSLGGAQDARDRIVQSLTSDPTGRSVSAQDKGALVYSLLHSELGRVNHTELSDQLQIPGIENMAQDQITKVMGGVNPNVVLGLVTRLNSANKNIDRQAAQLSESYTNQVNAKGSLSDADRDAALAPMKPFAKAAFRPAPSVNVNGTWYPRETVQQYVQQHPQAPDIGAANDALGGQ